MGLLEEDNFPHRILQVTLRNGSHYALDVSGHQYGYNEPVVPWALYVDSRVESIQNFKAFGNWEMEVLSDESCNGIEPYNEVRQFNKYLASILNETLVDWQKSNLPLSALLKLPKDAFNQKQLELIEFVTWYLSSEIKRTNSGIGDRKV